MLLWTHGRLEVKLTLDMTIHNILKYYIILIKRVPRFTNSEKNTLNIY